MNKLLFIAVLAPVLLLLDGPAANAAAPMFRESLAVTNKTIQMYGFNNAGDVLALVSLGEGDLQREQPVVVRGASMLRLTPVPNVDVDIAQATGISQRRDNGRVYIAGTAYMKDGFRRAAVWDLAQDGTFTFTTARNIVLPPESSAPGEQGASAGVAVNKAGVLVGSGSSFLASLAVRWQPPYDQTQVFPFSTSSAFVDIDENGSMLANGIEFDHDNASARFSSGLVSADGAVTEVPRLDSGATGFPNDSIMRRGEWVVGNARLGENSRGFAWKTGTSSAINLPNPASRPGAENIQAFSINASGAALGWINGGPGTQEIILWTQADGTFTPHRFADLLPAQPNLNPRADGGLNNDAGQVALVVRDTLFDVSYLRVYDQVTDGLVQLLTEAANAVEDDGRVEFKVKLTRAAGNPAPVTLHYHTADDTATAPANYTAADASITWTAGESGEKTIVIALNNNSAYDEFKSFKLRMGALTGAFLAGATEAVANISEPNQQVVVRNQALDLVGNGSVEVLQGQAQAVLQYERVGGSDGELTINGFTAKDFTAHLGVDYLAPPNVSLHWARGENGVKTLTVPLLNAGPLSSPRLFTVEGNVTLEGASFPWTQLATVTILAAGDTRAPVIEPLVVSAARREMTITVRAAQGATVQLQTTSSLTTVWSAGNEAVSADGATVFQIPIDIGLSQNFFQARIKP